MAADVNVTLTSYRSNNRERVGLLHDGVVYRSEVLPGLTMLDVVRRWGELAGAIDSERNKVLCGSMRQEESATLLAPMPSPVRNPFCVAGNYAQHVERSATAVGAPLGERKQAIFFTKPTGTVVGPYDDIVVDPSLTTQVDYELELAVVLGRGGRDIAASDAMDHVFGYCVANDVSARDIQVVKPTTDYLRGKGLDTFLPMGPGIVPKGWAGDYRDFKISLEVNGEVRQFGTPAAMIRSVEDLIAELSRGLTLVGGDILLTGTPSGTALEMEEPRYLEDGDIVRGQIDPIGVIENRVRHAATGAK